MRRWHCIWPATTGTDHSSSVAIRLDDQDDEVTVSVDVSRFPLDGGAHEVLLGAADAAMYRAKAAGRNRFEPASRPR